MIDRSWIGRELPAATFDLERGRLAFFARAIGETDPVYRSHDAARAAGHPDIPAPPTFLFSGELDSGALEHLVHDMGLDLARVLHGEQTFTYHAPAYAGDRVTIRSRIDDIYERKNGALEFIVKSSRITNDRGALVAEARSLIVVRNSVRQ
jgi:acyl dehydratase